MARSKEFDVDAALDRALDVFWARGYEATCMRELQQAMGIGRQSLYDTFGDKRQLFLAALERYNAVNGVRVEDALLTDDAGMDALRAWFHGLVRFLTPRGERHGCLLANTALEIGDADPEIGALCTAGERNSERGFVHALRNARAHGAFDGDVDRTARFLVTQMYGLTVMARRGASRAELDRMVDTAFVAVHADSDSN